MLLFRWPFFRITWIGKTEYVAPWIFPSFSHLKYSSFWPYLSSIVVWKMWMFPYLTTAWKVSKYGPEKTPCLDFFHVMDLKNQYETLKFRYWKIVSFFFHNENNYVNFKLIFFWSKFLASYFSKNSFYDKQNRGSFHPVLPLFTVSITDFWTDNLFFFIKIFIPSSFVLDWPILRFQKCFSLLGIVFSIRPTL